MKKILAAIIMFLVGILVICTLLLASKIEIYIASRTSENYNCCHIIKPNKTIDPHSLVLSQTVREQNCLATWYGNYFHGRATASGEIFDQWGMTAASTTYPIGSRLNVCRGDKCINVRVNDTGAFSHCLDLSRGAFNVLGSENEGVIPIEVSKIIN